MTRELALALLQDVQGHHPNMGIRKIYHMIRPKLRAWDLAIVRDALFGLAREHGLLALRRRCSAWACGPAWGASATPWPNGSSALSRSSTASRGPFPSDDLARLALEQAVTLYDHKRSHLSLQYATPARLILCHGGGQANLSTFSRTTLRRASLRDLERLQHTRVRGTVRQVWLDVNVADTPAGLDTATPWEPAFQATLSFGERYRPEWHIRADQADFAGVIPKSEQEISIGLGQEKRRGLRHDCSSGPKAPFPGRTA